MAMTDPMTKQDGLDLESRLRDFIRDREVQSIRWFVGVFAGIQITYFAITLGAVWFIVGHAGAGQ
jgi:hypothetical protein